MASTQLPVIHRLSRGARNATTSATSAGVPTPPSANIEAIERRIEADVDRGVLPPGTDAPALARHTGAMIQGMSQQARDGASRAELEALAEIALAVRPRG